MKQHFPQRAVVKRLTVWHVLSIVSELGYYDWFVLMTLKVKCCHAIVPRANLGKTVVFTYQMKQLLSTKL